MSLLEHDPVLDEHKSTQSQQFDTENYVVYE